MVEISQKQRHAIQHLALKSLASGNLLEKKHAVQSIHVVSVNQLCSPTQRSFTPTSALLHMNISSNAPIQRGPAPSPRASVSPSEKPAAGASDVKSIAQSRAERIDRYAQNANDITRIKEQVSSVATNPTQSLTGSAQVKSMQAGILGQNGILSKSVLGLPQPQNLPSTLTVLKERQNVQKPLVPGAYTFAKAYADKEMTQSALTQLGSGSMAKKNPPVPNPALSAPPPRGAQLQLYSPNLKAGNKSLDIQDHGINAF